jgi:CMP-N-acetylneuraminate monooxygenase
VKQKLFLKQKKISNLKKIKPKFFLPYAGFFETKLKRDKIIKDINQKNLISDYKNYCENNNIKLLNVEKKDEFVFRDNKLIKKRKIAKKNYKDINEIKYLNYYKNEYSNYDEEYIKNYFIKSGYKDNLILLVQVTNDDFKNTEKIYLIDFSKSKINFQKKRRLSSKYIKKKNKRIISIKVRKESFLNTIYNKLPWEDLTIGFQCQIYRIPNEYNSNFWFYFTNIYITDKNVRVKSKCNVCTEINQYVDNQLYKKNNPKSFL